MSICSCCIFSYSSSDQVSSQPSSSKNLVNEDIYPYYRKSISDWKNEYADECKKCSKSEECGGFFSSGLNIRSSSRIKAFTSS